MSTYNPTVDTWYYLYRGTWIQDFFMTAGSTFNVSNRVTVKTLPEGEVMVAEAGSDAQLLVNLGITEDLRDGV